VQWGGVKCSWVKFKWEEIWTYGIELWGCAPHSDIEIIQRYQSKILRTLTNAPRYVTNHTLHSDIHIPYVREVFQERIATYRTAIASHPNPHMVPLLHLPTTRRLKRRWTFDGTHWWGVVGHILRSPPNRTSPLADRKWCTVNVFWLLIMVLIKKWEEVKCRQVQWSGVKCSRVKCSEVE
jgi:hypothetical protein